MSLFLCTPKEPRKKIYRHVNTLTDDLIRSALAANSSLVRLSNIVFDHCGSIGPRSLWSLLEHPNSLSVLRVWECQLITDAEKDALKAVITDENLLLYFEWFPFNAVAEASQDVVFEDEDSQDEDEEEG